MELRNQTLCDSQDHSVSINTYRNIENSIEIKEKDEKIYMLCKRYSK